MSDIFNKEALQALDEHSEAEEMARVASPKLRLVLGDGYHDYRCTVLVHLWYHQL